MKIKKKEVGEDILKNNDKKDKNSNRDNLFVEKKKVHSFIFKSYLF